MVIGRDHQPGGGHRPREIRVGLMLAGVCAAGIGVAAFGGDDPPQLPLQTTSNDFFQPGTQPDPNLRTMAALVSASQCSFCHANYGETMEDPSPPFNGWKASMMAQSARDPIFHAKLTIAEQDATGSAEYCIRCHSPNAFIAGHTSLDEFTALDFEGVACNFCHRLVDPVFKPGLSPDVDEAILADLEVQGLIPPEGSNARYIIDPVDSRRGPFDDIQVNPHFGADIVHSPFHRSAEVCWTCHDVSNPTLMQNPDGTFSLTELDTPHPTQQQNDMFPVHRTYQEWLHSYYGQTEGVQHNGRFGGNHPTGVMQVCQDCHMPDTILAGCGLGGVYVERQDMPAHLFAGANTWVLGAIQELYGPTATGLSQNEVDAAIARNIDMLEKATDTTVEQEGQELHVRVINRSGHKFPTGFPDGRRAWINVRFFDADEVLISERGAYDFDLAELSEEDTKVYEAIMGVDAEQSTATGLPEGPTHHFVLANTILKDNRIPATGVYVADYADNGAAPVGASFQEGQHWDDTIYDIPTGTASAIVTVYYQTTSKSFIEFLRDENTTDELGQQAYDLWVAHGKSAPAPIDVVEISITPHGGVGDFNNDNFVDAADLALLLSVWGVQTTSPADLDGNGVIGPGDLAILLANWYSG